MIISSLIDRLGEFILTGIISLAIALATIRAHFANVLTNFERPGFLWAFVVCLLATLSIYLYLSINRCYHWRKRGRRDEETATFDNVYPGPGGRIYLLPVVFEEELRDSYGFQVGGAIRLDDSGFLGKQFVIPRSICTT